MSAVEPARDCINVGVKQTLAIKLPRCKQKNWLLEQIPIYDRGYARILSSWPETKIHKTLHCVSGTPRQVLRDDICVLG